MPDSRLRELERSAAGGDDDARAQLLRERVRGGDLGADRLRLAAYLNDPGALLACGEQASSGADLVGGGRGLQRWGDEPCVRASAAAADLGLTLWESWEPGELEPGLRLRAALDAALAYWRGYPSPELSREAGLLLNAAATAIDGASRHLAALEAEHGLSLREAWRAHSAGLAALFASESILWYLDERADPQDLAIRDVGLALEETRLALGSPDPVLAAVRGALIPWVLRSS